jgi:two-component sensor histidine kinase/integral membrane sensor domain MASE1
MLQGAGAQARLGAWSGCDGWRAWAVALGLAAVLGGAYFLAARLGLALLSKGEGVAVFWPASGVAAGALYVLGSGRARMCVAGAIVAASVVANLMGGRGLPVALAFGLSNAAEALLAAWLMERWSGRPFRFDALRGLGWFLAAAAVAPAVAAVGAALAMHQAYPDVSPAGVWHRWAAADALGIVTVVPLVVGLYRLAVERTREKLTAEGAAALALLSAASLATYVAPADWQVAQLPPAVLFPLLLWIAARSRPVCAAMAAFAIAAAIVGAATFQLGRFAGADIPVFAVQATVLVASLCALTLSALFAERQRGEAALMESNERLRLALGGAQLGVWAVDLATGAFVGDARDGEINGHDPRQPPRTLAQVRMFIHPEDLSRLDEAFVEARRTGAPCRAEYRVRAAGDCGGGSGQVGCGQTGWEQLRSGQVRWVAVAGTVVRDAAGRHTRMLGVTRDITEQKLAEDQKNLLLAELDHRVKNALAVVTAVASRTQETSASLTEFVAALDGRIKSMATAHQLLSSRKWQGLRLAELIERELEPYATGHNVAVEGPDAVLQAEAGQAMAMGVHELVTNAAKYGALSVEGGRVSVRWAETGGSNGSGSGATLVLDWVESGGPPVAAGVRAGYGTSVIRDLIPYELDGTVDLDLAPEGVRCRLRIPAKWLECAARPAGASLDVARASASSGLG